MAGLDELVRVLAVPGKQGGPDAAVQVYAVSFYVHGLVHGAPGLVLHPHVGVLADQVGNVDAQSIPRPGGKLKTRTEYLVNAILPVD